MVEHCFHTAGVGSSILSRAITQVPKIYILHKLIKYMVLNETANLTISEIARTVSPLITGNLLPLMNVLKAAGIIFIIYLVMLFIQMLSRFQDRRRLKRIEEKLDLLLEKNKKKK